MTKKHADKPAPAPETSETAAPAAAPAANAPTPEQLDPLQAAVAQAAAHWDKLLRTTADFENFKKRAARERQEAISYANSGLLLKLIPVLDNFDMALASAALSSDAAAQSMQAGVKMIAAQLRAALVEAGLEEIDAAGQPFDPNFHEAVSQQETTAAPEGHVVQQLRKGYKLRDRLLRPATVIVARKPAAAAGA